MKRWSMTLLAALFLLVAGCAQSTRPSGDSSSGSAPLPTGVSSADAAQSDLPNIPANASWTLYCQVVRTPDHVSRAKAVKDALIKSSGMRDWYVVHADGYSSLYYGFYRSIDDSVDRVEAARAQADRQRVVSFREPNGEMPFRAAVFVPLEQADPIAPPQWNLSNAPADAFWSVQIAAYADSPQRKQYAVDAVKAAREMGIPAYYYHGQNVSSVCIGTWPRSAVREQQTSGEYNTDPDSPLLVLSQAMPGLPSDLRDREGNRVKTVAPNIEIVDPTLTATLRKYPYHAVNGEQRVHQVTDPVTGKVRTRTDPSFLVQIPRGATGFLGGPAIPPQASPSRSPAPGAPSEPTKKPDQPGRLRSIGD